MRMQVCENSGNKKECNTYIYDGHEVFLRLPSLVSVRLQKSLKWWSKVFLTTVERKV